MPRLIFRVSLSATSRPRGERAGRWRDFSTNTSGSCSVRRITHAASAGNRPITNMPRQPMTGSRSGVMSAAASTPACQPSPT